MSELDYKESWASQNWCFWTVVLEKSLAGPLDCKEIQPIHPKGNQSWIFIERTDTEADAPKLWLSDVKSQLTGKGPVAGKDWRQEEKGMTEDEMFRRHHLLKRHEFEQAPEMVKDREARCAAVHGVVKSWTRLSDWTTTIRVICTHFETNSNIKDWTWNAIVPSSIRPHYSFSHFCF